MYFFKLAAFKTNYSLSTLNKNREKFFFFFPVSPHHLQTSFEFVLFFPLILDGKV